MGRQGFRRFRFIFIGHLFFSFFLFESRFRNGQEKGTLKRILFTVLTDGRVLLKKITEYTDDKPVVLGSPFLSEYHI